MTKSLDGPMTGSISAARAVTRGALAAALVFHLAFASTLVAQVVALAASPGTRDLIVLCTPDGLKVIAPGDAPAQGASAAACPCPCGLACGACGGALPGGPVAEVRYAPIADAAPEPQALDIAIFRGHSPYSGEPRSPPRLPA